MLATVIAVGVAVGVTMAMGAPGHVAMFAVAAIAAGSFATFLPAVLNVERQMWGVVVVAASMGRIILILAVALSLERSNNVGDARTALWIGVLCGAAAAMIIEAVVSIRILASMDKSALIGATEPRPAAQA